MLAGYVSIYPELYIDLAYTRVEGNGDEPNVDITIRRHAPNRLMPASSPKKKKSSLNVSKGNS